jgi:hypothetical protein
VRLQVFVPPGVRAKIRQLAQSQGKTLSEIVAARF